MAIVSYKYNLDRSMQTLEKSSTRGLESFVQEIWAMPKVLRPRFILCWKWHNNVLTNRSLDTTKRGGDCAVQLFVTVRKNL